MPCAQITFCSGVFEISQYLSIDSDHHAAIRGCVLCSVFSPQASKTLAHAPAVASAISGDRDSVSKRTQRVRWVGFQLWRQEGLSEASATRQIATNPAKPLGLKQGDSIRSLPGLASNWRDLKRPMRVRTSSHTCARNRRRKCRSKRPPGARHRESERGS